MKRNPELLDRNRATLLVVDIQEKILSVMTNPEEVVAESVKLIKGFQLLDCPIFITEQYPKGLGPTVKEVKDAIGETGIPEKMTFSCCGAPDLLTQIRQAKRDQIILCGIETHVCVWQTAMDLLINRFSVTVVRDAVSSRKESDYKTALTRMRMKGISVSSTEMVLFELLQSAEAEAFKDISKLIK